MCLIWVSKKWFKVRFLQFSVKINFVLLKNKNKYNILLKFTKKINHTRQVNIANETYDII
jgi:hypothetical protein